MEALCTHCAGACHFTHAPDAHCAAAGPDAQNPDPLPNPYQSEWRLRGLREALRDNRVFLEGRARSLRRTGERLGAELAQLRAHWARYGSAVQATLARFSAHPHLSLYRSVE